MPITPGTAGRMSRKEEEFISNAEAVIDGKLQDTYVPSNPHWYVTLSMVEFHNSALSLGLGSDCFNRVMAVIKHDYEEQGWRFELKSDQRDGDWIEIRGPEA